MRIGTYGNRRGQSTLEYLLIAAAIIAAIAIAATALIRPAMTNTMTSAGDGVNNAAAKFSAGLK